MNILIVEDNEAAAALLRELLQLQAYTVRCVHAGREALEAAAAEAFQVVLIDLMLPDGNGRDLARSLRGGASGRDGQPPLLVAMSGLNLASPPNALEAGLFDHVLQKPIDVDQLDQILASACAAS